jgi:hypothetical protein
LGKQRARRDGSLHPRAWHAFALSNGGVPIGGKIATDYGRKTRAGQIIRLLDIPADCRLGFGAFHDGVSAGFQHLLHHRANDLSRSPSGLFEKNALTAAIGGVAALLVMAGIHGESVARSITSLP